MNHFPQPGATPNGGDDLQPAEVEGESPREAERFDRLAGDRALLDRLMWAGYAGREWMSFTRALAEYGVAVVAKWIRSGRIFVECAKKARVVRRRRGRDGHEVSSIAGETVTHALHYFRDHVLVPGRWDASKGASLRTYFIGACVLYFPQAYSRSVGDERLTSDRHVDVDNVDLGHHGITTSNPELRSQVTSYLRRIGEPTTVDIVELSAAGYGHDEIGELVGFSGKAIESRLARLRKKKWENDPR